MAHSYILHISPAQSGFLSGIFSATILEARISEPNGEVVCSFNKDTPISLVRQITSTIGSDHYNKFERGRSIHLTEPVRDADKITVDDSLGDVKMILFNYLRLYNGNQRDFNLGQ